MLKIVNHIGTNRGPQGKHLKFPIATHPKGPYKHHLVVKVDTGADVNCMNEKTFNELFPEVELSVCPHEIQNFGNSVADISILGQFCTYLEFRGEKYLNTFIVTNVNYCPNLLSYGTTVDEITAKLQGMTVFTFVDFKKGYWMVVLHLDSRKLTCMVLPFGRFQWT